MSIIDDWLRQHPKLTLTRDQRQTLEELIDDEIDENEVSCDGQCAEDFDADDAEDAFKAGATAMRKSIAAEFSILDGVGSGVGNVIAGLAGFIEKMEIPEMPEED